MSVVATKPPREVLDLHGTRLQLTTEQADALPIQRIDPAPCTQACPAGVNVKAYVSLVAEGRFAEALAVVRERCPLPGICGRVCHHPCEEACHRAEVDNPVAIRALKRVAADMETELPAATPTPLKHTADPVAVIGSGPAGLTAAYDLRRAGYPVTVFEAESEPGGMLRYGIAAYRLPRDILDREIEALVGAGIEIRTDTRLGGDIQLDGLLESGYRAVLLALGAQTGRRLGVAGEENRPEVEDALAFLHRVSEGQQKQVEGKVIVVGGGSTAIEAARTALRLGAEQVEIVYRRDRQQMPASEEEVEISEQEGVHLRVLTAPSRIVVEGRRMVGLECLQVALGERDRSGRPKPMAMPGTEFLIEADTILAAIGQEADLSFLPAAELEGWAENRKLKADPQTGMSGREGVFAAGDVVSGPATIIEAIAAGHRAADAVRRYLGGTDKAPEAEPQNTWATEYGLPDAPPPPAPRRHPGVTLPQAGREFEEVEQVLSAADAIAEAQRCMRCGLCAECRICAPTCRRRHVLIHQNGAPIAGLTTIRTPRSFAAGLDAAHPTTGRLVGADEPGLAGEVAVNLTPERVDANAQRCRACGSCVAVCPFDALALQDSGDRQAAQLDPTLCRGCNLCTAICPTGALTSTSTSPVWWASRLEDVRHFAASDRAAALPCVVLRCQRRTDLPEPVRQRRGHAEIIDLNCIGQVSAGMLLELYRSGARQIVLAGCHNGDCRYGTGRQLAEGQADLARKVIQWLGGYEECVVCDWSGNSPADLGTGA